MRWMAVAAVLAGCAGDSDGSGDDTSAGVDGYTNAPEGWEPTDDPEPYGKRYTVEGECWYFAYRDDGYPMYFQVDEQMEPAQFRCEPWRGNFESPYGDDALFCDWYASVPDHGSVILKPDDPSAPSGGWQGPITLGWDCFFDADSEPWEGCEEVWHATHGCADVAL